MQLASRFVFAPLTGTGLAWAGRSQLALALLLALILGGYTADAPTARADEPPAAPAAAVPAGTGTPPAAVLVVQMLMRLALVDVLLVVAPLALLCWALPQTAGWVRLWSHTFIRAVFAQFVVVMVLKLGASLLTDLQVATVDPHGLSRYLAIAVLALTLKVPGLLACRLDDGWGFVRSYAYRFGAQGLDRRLGVAGSARHTGDSARVRGRGT